MAFVGGNLYLSSVGDNLFRLNTTTGAGTNVGAIGYSSVYGLATDNNVNLYGLTGTSILDINTSTGAGTVLVNYAGTALGAANGTAFVSTSVTGSSPGNATITSNMLLASVAGASSEVPSTGQALGDAIKYYRNDAYRAKQAAIEDCIFNENPPGCNIEQLGMEQQKEYANFADDVGKVGVEVHTLLQKMAIGYADVDMSVWEDTMLAKLKSFADFVSDIKST